MCVSWIETVVNTIPCYGEGSYRVISQAGIDEHMYEYRVYLITRHPGHDL